MKGRHGVWSHLKSFDVYPKLNEDVRIRTVSGAAVSVIAGVLMVVLFFSELSFYLSTHTVDHLSVDTSRSEKLTINIEVVFPAIPCAYLSLDVMDLGGSTQNAEHDIVKMRLDQDGGTIGPEIKQELGKTMNESNVLVVAGKHGACGSCYGAEETKGQCCNTCEEVKEAYRAKGWSLQGADHVEQCKAYVKAAKEELEHHEGCLIRGRLRVDHVTGNFHFVPGETFKHGSGHVHDLSAFKAGAYNVTHEIKKLSFGQEFPGQVNPLDGVKKAVDKGGRVYKYFIQVVPTAYQYRSGEVLNTNQFSVSEYETPILEKQGFALPGLFVFFEITPIKVEFKEEGRSFLHFITQICAIVGGVFTVAGLVDRVVYTSLRQMEKTHLGKLG